MATTYIIENADLDIPKFRLQLNSWIPWLCGHQAITLPGVVFCRLSVIDADHLTHEIKHIKQWKKYGIFGFLKRYFDGKRYKDKALEVEAREFAKTHAHLLVRVGRGEPRPLWVRPVTGWKQHIWRLL